MDWIKPPKAMQINVGQATQIQSNLGLPPGPAPQLHKETPALPAAKTYPKILPEPAVAKPQKFAGTFTAEKMQEQSFVKPAIPQLPKAPSATPRAPDKPPAASTVKFPE